MALQSNHEVSMECAPQAEAIAKEHTQTLGDKPLVDVSTDMMRSPEYIKFQTDLLSLSRNSKEIIAEKSGHFVIIDRPDVVIEDRKSTRLNSSHGYISYAVFCLKKKTTLFSQLIIETRPRDRSSSQLPSLSPAKYDIH